MGLYIQNAERKNCQEYSTRQHRPSELKERDRVPQARGTTMKEFITAYARCTKHDQSCSSSWNERTLTLTGSTKTYKNIELVNKILANQFHSAVKRLYPSSNGMSSGDARLVRHARVNQCPVPREMEVPQGNTTTIWSSNTLLGIYPMETKSVSQGISALTHSS